jgi:thiosulfate/3-mercaptopyruvate sulfurtransferase
MTSRTFFTWLPGWRHVRALSNFLENLAGLDFANRIIAYCRIGERSAHTWFVLHELLGLPDVKNYDGSWTEYGSLVGVPVAVGDE